MKPQKEWVHMDTLEPEKLEWMRDLPSPRKKGTKKVIGDIDCSPKLYLLVSRSLRAFILFVSGFYCCFYLP